MDRLVKIVRDGHARGVGDDRVVYRAVDRDESVEALRRKLVEEAIEYLQAPSAEELADVYEIIRALSRLDLGVDVAEIVAIADEKRARRGGFDEGIGMWVTVHTMLEPAPDPVETDRSRGVDRREDPTTDRPGVE